MPSSAALPPSPRAGSSPTDVSFNKYVGAGEYAGSLFMILGSLPYIRYVQLVNGSALPLWRDSQVRAYLRWLGAAVLAVTVWRVWSAGEEIEPVFRQALFNLTSIMSSTGFFSGTFPTWGGFMLVVAFVVGVVGACSGSSAAGLTVFRVQLVVAVLRREMRRIVSPTSVDPIRYDGRPVENDVLSALIMFVSSYILILGVLCVAMTLTWGRHGLVAVRGVDGAWATSATALARWSNGPAPSSTFRPGPSRSCRWR